MKSSSCALLALVLALLLGGAFYFYSQKNQVKDKPLTSQEGISENSSSESSPPTVIEPEKAALTDVSGGEGQGIANRIYSTNKFIHTITAQLKSSESGMNYMGWLIKQDGDTEDVVSSGKLEQNGENNYYLEFRSETDYMLYNKVLVTLQVGGDKPETTILEGQFK